MTARDIITDALKMIGYLASGETATANDASDALTRFNDMIAFWNIEGLNVHKIVRETFPLVASQSSRTIGTGGNFNTTKPTEIIRAGVVENNIETPIDIVTAEEWSEIPYKSLTSTNPSKIWIEGTHPLDTINFYPVPTSTNSLALYSRKPITGTLALTDSVSLPDGYALAMKSNLAVMLSPEFGKEVSPLLLKMANESLAAVQRKNVKPSYMKTDAPTGCGSFDIYTGE